MASAQHSYCTEISWDEAVPGNLVFYPGDEHVGIVCGFDADGNMLVIHCAYSANNVVVTSQLFYGLTQQRSEAGNFCSPPH